MKRDPALQDLSRDHFTTLNLVVDAQRVVQGSDHAKPLDVVWVAWANHWPRILAHFELEEELIVPILDTESWGEDAAHRLREDHARIRDEADHLAGNPDPMRLWNLAEALRIHIRWEEEVLYGMLQDKLGTEQLAWLGEKDEALRQERGIPWGPSRA